MRYKTKNNCSGLTLAELLVALMVASIIFAAVASLAYAMGAANDSSDDVSLKQAQIRYATVRLGELVRNSKLAVLSSSGEDLAVWRADNDFDNLIDFSEFVIVEIGSKKDYIGSLEFPDAADWPGYGIPLEEFIGGDAKMTGLICFEPKRAKLIPECSNVSIYTEAANANNRFVSISFDIKEGGQDRHYQISSYLRCWAGNLLDGTSIVSDDD